MLGGKQRGVCEHVRSDGYTMPGLTEPINRTLAMLMT